MSRAHRRGLGPGGDRRPEKSCSPHRRQGKSLLLRRLTETTGGFYYQALEQGRSQALDAFGAAAGEYLGVPQNPTTGSVQSSSCRLAPRCLA